MSSTLTRRPPRLRALAAVSAVVALGATAASCGASEDDARSGDKVSIQFVSPLPSFPQFKTLGECMEAEAKKRGADFTVTGPTGQAPDPTTMISQIQQATVAKKSAIVTVPLSDGFAPVLQQAQKKGINTVTLLGAGGAGSGDDLNLGYDWRAIGQQYVDAIAKLPGQQGLGLVAAANTGVGQEWIDGVTKAAEATDDVKILGTVYTGDDATKALPQVNALLSAHPDIDMVATHMGTVTPGAVAALEAKGLTGKVNLLVNGSDNGGREALSDGAAKLMFVQDVCGSGTKAVDAVMDLSQGKTVGKTTFDTEVIEQSQVQSYLDKGWS